ncbi:MAG TPA: threonine synthase [Polyangia bacterium]|nr:threonine synthase [Polyangia bacterium]
MTARSLFVTLTCWRCGAEHDPAVLQNTCREPGCGRPLVARYTLDDADPGAGDAPARGLWRHGALLPDPGPDGPVTLGEGDTPLLKAPRMARELGLDDLRIKDESQCPTGSFKARGLAVAVTMVRRLGAAGVALPSAGNAGSAAAAYAARAGLRCLVVVPADTPPAFKDDVRACGGELIEHPGPIDECGAVVAGRLRAGGWFDVSTLKEPYRLEGKKTIGLELAEQLGGEVPDAIVYPTGGGTGLLGIWKAFAELEALGRIGPKRPRMWAVQPEGCAPVVRAFDSGAGRCERVTGATTHALGLRVPKPFADEWILAVLRRSGGGAVAVSEDGIREGTSMLARLEGLVAAPESGAAVAGLRRLLASGRILPAERVVLINTGAG